MCSAHINSPAVPSGISAQRRWHGPARNQGRDFDQGTLRCWLRQQIKYGQKICLFDQLSSLVRAINQLRLTARSVCWQQTCLVTEGRVGVAITAIVAPLLFAIILVFRQLLRCLMKAEVQVLLNESGRKHCLRVAEPIEWGSIATLQAQQTIKSLPYPHPHKPNAHYVSCQREIIRIRPHLAHVLIPIFEK